MKTITFYSYKGGVGRSLALANIANKLAEFGKKVCLLDFDLEAPGLHIKFGDSIEKKKIKKGIVDYIYEFTNNNNVPDNILDFVTDIDLFQEKSKKISLIAAGDTSNKSYWKKLALLNWRKLFYEKDSMGVDFFYNMKAQIAEQIKPDFLLIDSRTGITDIAGITMSILADEVVLFAANNKENLDGIGQVLNFLTVPENSVSDTPPKINVVLSRIPFFTDPKDKHIEVNIKHAAIRSLNSSLKAKDEKYQIEKVFVIHSDPELEMQERFKIKPNSNALAAVNYVPITSDYLELFEAITSGTIVEAEIQTLENYRKAEMLYQKALNASEAADKIKLLNEVTTLYPNHHNAYLYLGAIHYQSGDFAPALVNFNKTSEITSQYDDEIGFLRVSIYYKQKDYPKALSLMNELAKKTSDQLNVNLALGSIYSAMKEYRFSVKHFEKAALIEPENALAWNGLANTFRLSGKYEQGFEAVYKALDLNPQFAMATATLAELYAATGNKREFYKNFDLALSFGIETDQLQQMLKEDNVYHPFFNDEKFLAILEKYDIRVELEDILSKK